MKKVIFTEGKPFYMDFDEMIEREEYVGWIPEVAINQKYCILTFGDYKGLAIDGNLHWIDISEQKHAEGTYFSFKSRTDLFLWMAGDESVELSEIIISSHLSINKENSNVSDVYSSPEYAYIKDFNELIEGFNFQFIGFIPKYYHGNKPKFFILVQGSYKGLAIKADLSNTWIKKEDQKNAEGDYFIFSSREELIDWLGFHEEL
jgi:hypothetical protein